MDPDFSNYVFIDYRTNERIYYFTLNNDSNINVPVELHKQRLHLAKEKDISLRDIVVIQTNEML
jgi:hypothetical protein